jgi:hypothetical protein
MTEFINYEPNLYKLLGIKSNKQYKIDEIKTIIYSRKLLGRDINNYFPCIKCCSCGKCSINQDRLFEYITANFIGSTPKNILNYYEYTQEPVEIMKMTFE